MVKKLFLLLICILVAAAASAAGVQRRHDAMFVLDADTFEHHVDLFNTMEPENIVNHISNDRSWAWMRENIPFFDCPDKGFEQIYYFRWWTFRKHLKETPDGFVFTEFLDKVSHSGKYNTISCALGHHIYEGTWLRDQRYIDDYARFWYTGHQGDLQPHLHRYSNWGTWALYRRYLVNRDERFVVKLLDAFIRDYQTWTKGHGLENGLYWQYDVRDWFCLDNVLYHGRSLTILWDRSGEKYGKGRGLHVFADGVEIAGSDKLTRITGVFP